MILLATVRKYRLGNQLSCLKRRYQKVLLSTLQLNKYGMFRNMSTKEDDDRIRDGKKYKPYNFDKPPEKPEIDDCCGSGCKNCVWLKYVVEIKFYYEDKEKLQEAVNSIPEPDIKAFIEMELKNLFKKER